MDNKPLETDDQEESQDEIEDLFDDSSDETSQDSGSEDVGGKSDFQKKLEEVSGRTFKNEDDAIKHYKNLVSFVGKKIEPKVEPKAKPDDELRSEVAEIKEWRQQREFMDTTPEAKEHMALVKAMSLQEGVPYGEAWEKVKPYVEGYEATKKEKTTVDSKPRITPMQSKKRLQLEQAVREGGGDDVQRALLKEYGLI